LAVTGGPAAGVVGAGGELNADVFETVGLALGEAVDGAVEGVAVGAAEAAAVTSVVGAAVGTGELPSVVAGVLGAAVGVGLGAGGVGVDCGFRGRRDAMCRKRTFVTSKLRWRER
jgi:hypothetical protein